MRVRVDEHPKYEVEGDNDWVAYYGANTSAECGQFPPSPSGSRELVREFGVMYVVGVGQADSKGLVCADSRVGVLGRGH